MGGMGIATGIALLGHKVMKTVGEKITELTNSRGFSVDFSMATTVVAASLLGLPVSSTHAATGAVVGVGLSQGVEAVNFRVFGKIILIWLITVPAAASITVIVYKVLSRLFIH